MKLPGWRVVLVLAGLLLVVVTLYVLLARLGAAAEFPQRATLRSFIRLDAELHRDLLRLRTGLLRNYDSVNATVATMREQQLTLQREIPAAFRPNIAALAAAIEKNEERVEQFKSDIAVSRNSLMYLTLLADRRFERMAAGEDAVLNALLARLDNRLVRYLYSPQMQTREPAQDVLRSITARVWPPSLRAEVQELSVHGGVVMERIARVDETLGAIHADPLGEQVRRLEAELGDVAHVAAERAHIVEIAIFGVALLLAVYSAYAVVRLRNAARELAGSEARFRATFEQAAVGMAHVATDGRFLHANQKICDIFGYSREELQTLTFQSITYADDLNESVDHMRELLEGRIATLSAEKRYIHKSGSLVWANLTVALVRTAAGAPDYFISVIEDISARKRIELEQERLSALVNASSEFIGTATLDGQLTYVNPAGCRMLGLDPAVVTRKTIPDFVTPAFLPQLMNTVLPAATRDGFWSGESCLRHFLTGDEIAVQQYVFTIKNPRTGAPMLIANISHDIRERKRAEAQIHQLNTELEQRVVARTAQLAVVNKQLEMFAYTVSHDLRAPIRAIDGFSLALLEDCGATLDPTGRGYLERVRAATQRMEQLINDLLRFSRVTRLEISPGEVDLAELARTTLLRLAQAEPARQVETNIAQSLPAHGDASMLAIVLDNLLGNAWKYTSKTPHARIALAAEQQAGQTVYYVRDNCVGFDMRYAGKLFGVFQRLHHEDAFPGAGVGLATVASIINRHGGKVWADSTPNQGATFYFTLPRAEST